MTLLDEGLVVRAAPIVHYLMDWTMEEILAYAEKHGWTVQRVRS